MMPCIIQEANGLSQCGQSAATQAGTPPASLCTPNQMHRPACAPLCSTHRASRSSLFLFRLAWGKKNVRIIVTLEKMQTKKKKKIQSAQSREAISTCGHTLLPCFTSKSRNSLFTSLYHWVFAVPCNSYQHHVAICKVEGKTIVYSPM